MTNALEAYRSDSILALPREQLLLRIYEALLGRIGEAEIALGSGDRAAAGRAISKAFEIVSALRDALRPETGAKCVPSLDQLYRTVGQWLLEANLTQSPQLLASTRRVVGTLKEGWDVAVQSAR